MDFNGYTLISDLDGTLLDDNKNISDGNREAISYFQAHGGKFALATGRAPIRADMFKDIIKTDIPSIFLNGILISDFHTGEVFLEKHIDDCIYNIAKDVFEKYEDIGFEIFANNTNYYVRIDDCLNKQIEDEGYGDRCYKIEEVGLPWQKVLLGSHINIMDEINQRYSEFKDKIYCTRSGPCYYELQGVGISKGAGLLNLCDITGIDRTKTICIGDNLNDLEMIRNAGIGVMVGNGNKELKKYAKYVVSDNNHSPIYNLINLLIGE